MGGPRQLSHDELLSLTQRLRDLGVDEFEYKGLKVKFDPTLRQGLTMDMSKQELDQAMERFKQTNKDDDALLDWSV